MSLIKFFDSNVTLQSRKPGEFLVAQLNFQHLAQSNKTTELGEFDVRVMTENTVDKSTHVRVRRLPSKFPYKRNILPALSYGP